jgi:CheY-like chemotaxis protein
MTYSVFIVEDEPFLQYLYESLLKKAGFVVMSTAKNGEEAINKFRVFPNKPDFILMDHRMPIKSGLEAMEEILRTKPPSKIIFVSADRSIKEKALSSGAVGFLEKPFDSADLINYLKDLGQTET